MASLVMLFPKLMANVVILAAKPFSLCIWACVFPIKATFIVVQTCMELVKAAVFFHIYIFWKAFTWLIVLISLPKHVLTALQRERLLEQNVKEMQLELESLVQHMEKLEDHLHKAIKERTCMKLMLVELDEELEKAICKIELLEGKLEDARNENLQMKEIQGKAERSFKGGDHTGNGGDVGTINNHKSSCQIAPSKSSYEVGGASFQDLKAQRDTCKGKSKSDPELFNMLQAGPTFSQATPVIQKTLDIDDILHRQRGVAISQSLFSATLSLLVAMIIWEAEDPCVPLVLALFTVVGMSLRSVLQFFCVVKNKHASEAVALLSFNMFILGILTYPTLPRVVRVWLH